MATGYVRDHTAYPELLARYRRARSLYPELAQLLPDSAVGEQAFCDRWAASEHLGPLPDAGSLTAHYDSAFRESARGTG